MFLFFLYIVLFVIGYLWSVVLTDTLTPKSIIDTSEGSDDEGKVGQPTNRHDIVFGRWIYERSLMSDDALVRRLNCLLWMEVAVGVSGGELVSIIHDSWLNICLLSPESNTHRCRLSGLTLGLGIVFVLTRTITYEEDGSSTSLSDITLRQKSVATTFTNYTAAGAGGMGTLFIAPRIDKKH